MPLDRGFASNGAAALAVAVLLLAGCAADRSEGGARSALAMFPPIYAAGIDHGPEAEAAEERPLEEEHAPARSRYGWQIAIPDASAGLAFAAASASIDGNRAVGRPLMTSAEVLFLVGGPTVHALHGNGLNTVGSFGMRVLFPIGGHALAGVLGNGRGVDTALVIGGGVIASIVDITILAVQNAEPPPMAQWLTGRGTF